MNHIAQQIHRRILETKEPSGRQDAYLEWYKELEKDQQTIVCSQIQEITELGIYGLGPISLLEIICTAIAVKEGWSMRLTEY